MRENLRAIGYGNNGVAFNKNHMWGLLIGVSVITAQSVYAFQDTNAIEEYTLCFFMIICAIGIFISFVSTMLRENELTDLINNIESAINESM